METASQEGSQPARAQQSSPGVRIWHIAAKMRWRIVWLAMAISLAFAVPAAFFSVWIGLPPVILAVFGGILGPQVVEWWAARRSSRPLASMGIAADLEASEAAFHDQLRELEVKSPRLSPMISGLKMSRVLVERLLAAGATGRVYWICAPDAPERNLNAVTDPFEPVLLARGAKSPAADVPSTSTFSQRWREQSRELSRIFGSRTWKIFMVFGILSALFGVAVLAKDMVTSLMHGYLPRYWGAFLPLLVLISVVAVWNLLWPRNCVAVTGGLVFRRSGWREQAWRLRMFRRSSSVLVYWRERVVLACADADGVETVLLSPELAEIAIRAWLSPISPPGVETLSDLR